MTDGEQEPMVSRSPCHGEQDASFAWHKKSGIYVAKMVLYRFGFIDLKPLLLDILSSKTYYKSTSVIVFIPYNIFDFFQFPGLAWHTNLQSGIYVVKGVYIYIYDGFIDLKPLFISRQISGHQKHIINRQRSWCLYHIYLIFSNFRVSRGIQSGIYTW